MSHDCERIELLMSVYRELDPGDRRDVDVAVGECSGCGAAWADEQIVLSHLAAIPELATPSGLKGRLLDIPDGAGPSLPFVDEAGARILLLLLGASALWWFTLTAGPAASRVGDVEVDTPREAPLAADIGSTDGLAKPLAPIVVRRTLPVTLVTPSAITTIIDDFAMAGPDKKISPAVLSGDGIFAPGRDSRVDSSSASDTPTNLPGSPPATDGRTGGAGGSSAIDDGSSTDADTASVCVTVDVRPFFDLPEGDGDCAVCGDGRLDENEMESSRDLASDLPSVHIVVEYMLPSGEWEADKEVTIPAGTLSHLINLRCELFNRGDVTLRAAETGGGNLCPTGSDSLSAQFARTARTARFAIPFMGSCPPSAPSPTATATATRAPTTSPEPTSTALPTTHPTAPTTPEPLDPDPAMPTQVPSPTPTATYQPSPTPTPAWPQDGGGLSPAP